MLYRQYNQVTVSKLRKALIKLAHNKPELRGHLIPLIRRHMEAAGPGSPERLMQGWSDGTADGKCLNRVGKALEKGDTPDPKDVAGATRFVQNLTKQKYFEPSEKKEQQKMLKALSIRLATSLH